jgi:hypothetical protein
VEKLGASCRREGLEALSELMFDLLQAHGIGTLSTHQRLPGLGAQGFSRLGAGTWWP